WETARHSDRSQWAVEAGEHHNRLTREMARREATRWPLNVQRLPEAVHAGDRQAVAQLIGFFPAAAQRYVEEEVLLNWAQALSQNRLDEAQEHLGIAKAIAAELARLTGDRYLLEAVELIVQASRSPGRRFELLALQAGHLAFAQARLADRARDVRTAARLYRQAERSLARAGSPLRGSARLGLALALSYEPHKLASALALLTPVEQEARARHYWNLLSRVQANRGFFLFYQSRYLEALAAYDEALGIFAKMKDRENLANGHARKIGIFRTLGQNELAWTEAFQAQRYAPYVVDVQARHHFLGETAAVALALGYPRIALLYQRLAVRMIQDELANTPGEQGERIRGLQNNLAIALRAQAAIELHLGHGEQARRDLDTATRLTSENGEQADQNIRRALLARIQQVKGQSLLGSDPQQAIAAFTEALTLTPEEYRTLRVTLFIDRAEAHKKAGHKNKAKQDLQDAIDELREEERSVLKGRSRGKGENLWDAYFSRFQKRSYQRLIGQLAEEEQSAEAFAYAEKARAFEPLNLVLQLDLVPKAFCRFARNGEPLTLDRIQACLPRGTFLIEYSVQEDRTLIWLLSRDHFEMLTRPVGRSAIEAWTTLLHREAEQGNLTAFEGGLSAPFSALLAAPLARIQNLPDGRGEGRRLVFVPDAAIHGLPLAALRNPTTRRYVIQDFPVSVAASATLYVFSLLHDESLPPTGIPRALLMGDPAFTKSELTRGLDRLPYARREVDRIGRLYAPAVDVRIDGAATVPQLIELARKSAVVHLAGHAIVNPQAPFRSVLLLAPSKNHSGALYAEELLVKLRLDETRLFVLSTCSGAGGHPVGPEGLAALVRPLLVAGSPAVIGSLWNVRDAPTEELLVRFHHRYRQGYDAAKALQLAQLELLGKKSAGLHSVLTWAPFQVIGHSSSPFPPTTENAKRDTP
ncbi:MAG TPA: CHAT domain-containing protein, partial [Thermoanaerobaculia bacterium]|nr:CHAT domain-containing protein [Thermoanaerobaculia bacterium]